MPHNKFKFDRIVSKLKFLVFELIYGCILYLTIKRIKKEMPIEMIVVVNLKFMLDIYKYLESNSKVRANGGIILCYKSIVLKSFCT